MNTRTWSFFIPNPIDPSIDIYKNFIGNKEFDIFLAISHGQHRAILKRDFIDDRVYFIEKLTKKANYNRLQHLPVPNADQFDFSKIDFGLIANLLQKYKKRGNQEYSEKKKIW